MQKQNRRLVGLVGTIASALLFAASASAEERTVNFYNWSNYMAPEVLEDFTRETGIKVVYDTFDANETLETRLLAGKSGYDVVVPTGYFLQRQITAKVFLKLDKSKLPNLANAWPVVTGQLATYDPGNQFAVNYMWGTVGIGYNVKKAREVLGLSGAPGDAMANWDIVFKPENLAKFRDCGVHMLDSADDIFPAALNYLGLDPNSTKQADLEKSEIGLHSTPTIVGDVIIVGSSMFEGLGYVYATNVQGQARAFDARTGKLLPSGHAQETIDGVPVSLVIYPDAGHCVTAPAQAADVRARAIAWFDTYVKNAK